MPDRDSGRSRRLGFVEMTSDGEGESAITVLNDSGWQMGGPIMATGADCRVLTMSSFIDNLLRQVQAIKDRGTFFSPICGGLKAPN